MPDNNFISELNETHDKAFKNAMRHIEVAKDFLQHHLSVDVKKLINFDTLQLQNISFIDENLKASESDILYRIETLGKKTKKMYIYILAEHQRRSDRWLPFRLVKYMCGIADEHLKNYPKQKRLPLIIPIVFYNGIRAYHHSMNVFDLFESDKNFVLNLMTQPFQLIDLNKIADDEIRQHQWAGLMESVMKHSTDRDMLSFWQDTIKIFSKNILQCHAGEKYLISMLIYSIHQGDISNIDEFFNKIRLQLTVVNQSMGERVMTIAERLKQSGRLEGRLEGRQEGRQEERVALACKMLQELHDPVLVSKITGLAIEDFYQDYN